jgi:hypothetical protein
VHWLLTEPRTPPQDLLPVAAEVFLASSPAGSSAAPPSRKGSLPVGGAGVTLVAPEPEAAPMAS